MEEEDDITEEEMEELSKYLQRAPVPEEKVTIPHFLDRIRKTKDTTKVGNLDDNELYSVRILKEAARFNEIHNLGIVANYINSNSEDILATSDSKKGFLIQAAITTKREAAVKTPKEKKKTAWFKKNVESEE